MQALTLYVPKTTICLLNTMAKRKRPEAGFYKYISDLPIERRKRPRPTREVLPEYYLVERVVAKKKIQGKWEYLVKWKDYSSEQMTWEPASHLPEIAITAFESPPTPDSEWVCECRERLALILERGLKTSTTTVATVEFRHKLLRYLFPRLPSDLSSSRYLVTEQDFVAAGLGDYLERVVTVNGGKRQVVFPVVMQLFLGRAPGFLTVEGDPARSRLLEKVRISFNKNC